jgi:hypothetical protein
MYAQIPGTSDQWRQNMEQKERDGRRWSGENLYCTERCYTRQDPATVGLWVGFLSPRATELHLRLYQEIFSRGFVRPTKVTIDESGTRWAWYGYLNRPITS